MNFVMELNGITLEYYEDTHTYLYDGIILPSITGLMKHRFANKYAGISKETLARAAHKGTEVHEAIEQYITAGTPSELPEVRNFAFLQKWYGFEVSATERPVVLYHDGRPIAAGRFDLQLEMNGETGGADIKRTATLDKEYLALQLNLYRIATRQTYGIEWKFLKGIHLRDTVRKFIDIPINEGLTIEFIKETQDE